MNKTILSFMLTAALLLCSCAQHPAQASAALQAASPAEVRTASAEPAPAELPGVTPEAFGAKGDGLADDTQAAQ